MTGGVFLLQFFSVFVKHLFQFFNLCFYPVTVFFRIKEGLEKRGFGNGFV